MSTAGPDGDSVAVNSCGRADGTIYVFSIGLDEPVDVTADAACPTDHNQDWTVVITINDDPIVSGNEYTITADDLSHSGVFNNSGPTDATGGAITIEFDGEWGEGTEYTGSYWIDSPDMPLIEGAFQGVTCIAEQGCG